MKKLNLAICILSAFAAAAATATAAQAQDLEAKEGAYFKFVDRKIDLKSTCVVIGKTMKLTKNAAIATKDGKYQFVVGFIVTRKDLPLNKPMIVKVSFSDWMSGKTTGVYTFEKGKDSMEVLITTPFLSLGSQRLDFVVDRDNKVKESNENNNRVMFTVIVVEEDIKDIVEAMN